MSDDASVMAGTPLEIVDAVDRRTYEAHVDGVLAGILRYARASGRITLIHTEVLPDFEGRGIASALVRHALAEARRDGRRVIAACPYVQSYLAKHPEEAVEG